MITIHKIKYLIAAGAILTAASCKKYVNVGAPPGSVDSSVVYNNASSATAAVLSLYSSGNFRDGLLNTTLYGGLAADELNYMQIASYITDFQNNSVASTNSQVSSVLWMYPYVEILNANADINGLQKATSLTPAVANQLIGEAKFWRATAYFNLVNCFGDVPLALSSVALNNSLLPRTSADKIYAQILSDLKDAKAGVSTTYPSTERARVNQYAVSAMLARVYLYRKDWVNAEAEATAVINSGVYSMSTPDVTFQKTSNETILQIYNLNGFTQWGVSLVPASTTSVNYILAPGFVNAFETGDKRLTNWVAAIGTSGTYNVSKYKLRTATAGNEYYVVLRLAEQYLIRAEARAQQGKLTGANSAETDLNVIRTRAGIASKTNLSQAAMLLAIEQERKVELFGEYAHRWFDLKRTASVTTSGKTRADDVLGPLKGVNWQSTDILWPISSDEINRNPNLTQNPGY